MTDLLDPSSAWRARVGDAQEIAQRLSREVADFRATRPISAVAEPAGDKTAYRVSIRAGIPVIIPLLVGDILHNLRSSLLTMELLDEAWSAAWRESAGTEPGQSREERAETAWGIYRAWVAQ